MASVGPPSVLPDDYLERVYAGVLGKLIGVYVGRPIEQWPHKRIMEVHGHIRYYVNEKAGWPLVAADDDVSGTFTFIRAIEEHGIDLSVEDMGRTWLNNAIEKECPFWWGGKGYSTEHTVFLNLRRGIMAPESGAAETNGKTVSEQIGGQIFIDGWGLVAPGQPELAAHLADGAASVSHDGEAKFAARMWASMESEAFVSKNVEHLLATGLQFVPTDCLLRKVVADVRQWSQEETDWIVTRQKIEDEYGYEKFPGSCHVMPNFAIMIMSLIYGGHSFHEAMHIINTAGWDTDCNSGNVGCLVAIMHGLRGFENGPDWRGPLADRAIVSSADSGYTINSATRIAYDITNSGRRLGGLHSLKAPKDKAQFHFSLPGSVQGFQTYPNHIGHTEQARDDTGQSGLAIRLENSNADNEAVEVMTPTFVQPDLRKGVKAYNFVGAPLLYPGQLLKAILRADPSNTEGVTASLRLKVYGPNGNPEPKKLFEENPDLDKLLPIDGPSTFVAPGKEATLEWTIPDDMDSQPIGQIGIALECSDPLHGTVWLDRLGWTGVPNTIIKRPAKSQINGSAAWRDAWINNADTFNWYMPQTFGISKDQGEGSIIYGTREWTDYTVTAKDFTVHLATSGGLMARNQGVNRYYALILAERCRVVLVKAVDEHRVELVSASFDRKLDQKYELAMSVSGDNIMGWIDGQKVLEATDDRFTCGGIGLLATGGSVSAEEFRVTPI